MFVALTVDPIGGGPSFESLVHPDDIRSIEVHGESTRLILIDKRLIWVAEDADDVEKRVMQAYRDRMSVRPKI